MSRILPHCILDICKRWESHSALEDLVLDLHLRGPEDDLIRVETGSHRFMYICTVLLFFSVGLLVANAPDVLQPCGLFYYP